MEPTNESELRYFAAERVHGSFERSVRLPEFVDANRITASFDKGVLLVTVPNAEAAKPRKISIDVGQRQGRINGSNTAVE
ncbi:MAG: Hsp20 family protein [bacterium]